MEETKKGALQTGESPAQKAIKLSESVLHPFASPETQMNVPREAEDRKEYESILQDKMKLLEEAKKKKGVNVRSTVSGNGAKRTIDQTLEDTFDAIQSRASH